MKASAEYYGTPKGYADLVHAIPAALGGSVVYHNDDATIYRLDVVGHEARQPTSRQARALMTPKQTGRLAMRRILITLMIVASVFGLSACAVNAVFPPGF